MADCNLCNGIGQHYDDVCWNCKGEGTDPFPDEMRDFQQEVDEFCAHLKAFKQAREQPQPVASTRPRICFPGEW